ncbi:hypothetical protein KCU72_g13785, partial [Aureobasidium melanogenum]
MRCSPLSSALALGCAVLSVLPSPGSAAFITFDNCLDQNIRDSTPLHLQFVPLFVDARFNTSDPSHNLNVTIYGNVSGQATQGNYPPPTDPSWKDPDDDFGKIVDLSPSNNRYSTLFQRYQVLTFDAYEAAPSRFCNSTVNDSCPLAPSFFANPYDPYDLSAFSV